MTDTKEDKRRAEEQKRKDDKAHAYSKALESTAASNNDAVMIATLATIIS